jgi:hypothetical protein
MTAAGKEKACQQCQDFTKTTHLRATNLLQRLRLISKRTRPEFENDIRQLANVVYCNGVIIEETRE